MCLNTESDQVDDDHGHNLVAWVLHHVGDCEGEDDSSHKIDSMVHDNRLCSSIQVKLLC